MQPNQRRLGANLTTGVSWIIAISVGFFLLYVFLGKETQAQFQDWLVLSGNGLFDGHIWKLATTSLFAESPVAFVFDILMMWLFIPTFERFWGTKRFLRFFATTLIAGNICGALVGSLIAPSTAVLSLTPFIFASICAYGIVFANQPVQFFGVVPIKGKNLAIGMICFVTIFILLEQRWVHGASVYGAMAMAYAMTKGHWTPKSWWLRYRHWSLRRKYKILDGGKKKDEKRWMN